MASPTENQENIAAAAAAQLQNPAASEIPEGLTGSVMSDIRWKEQCVLAQFLPYFSDNKVQNTSASKRKPWHYVTSFSTNDEKEGTADFMNRLHMSEGDKDFVNMNTFERNNLLWNIELSKVLYKPSIATQGSKKIETIDYEFDKEIPLIFEKMAKEDMDAFTAGTSPAHHKESKNGGVVRAYGGKIRDGSLGRPQTGYGIKSFSWSLIGANPETVRNDIEAVLVLEFQNFEQLSRVRLHTDENNKTTPYSLLDLIGYGPNSPKNELGRQDEYNPAFYEIKAHVKWDANDYSRDNENITLKEKIKGQKTTLFLTMIDHDFSISQLGTFTLTLSYRARLESLTSELRTNVVFPPVPVDGTLQASDLKKIDIDIEKAAEGCLKEEYERLLEEREDILRLARYGSFKNLLGTEFLGNYRAGLNHPDYPSRWSQDYALMTARANKIKLTGKPFSKTAENYRIQTLGVERSKLAAWAGGYKTNNTEQLSSAAAISEELPAAQTGDVSALAAIDNILGELESFNLEQVSDVKVRNFYDRVMSSMSQGSTLKAMSDAIPGTPHPINFIYFGELLDLMAHRAFSDQNFSTFGTRKGSFGSGKMIKVISGPIKLKIQGKKNPYTCSLSDIPISIEAFSDFWFRNVIETEREIYSFMDFVRDMGSQCYDPVTGDVLVEKLPAVNNPDLVKNSKPEDLFHYIVLYLENHSGSKGLTGVEDADASRGIYHLKIHQGILQSIDFSKSDQPFLRESRFFIHNKNPLVHLSNVYNVNASMIGNTCFYPGDTVYINPVGFGPSLGDPMSANSLSSVMGLGGYHTIISVSNTVSRDFTTDIVAQWTSNGNGEARSSTDITEEGCKDKPGVALLSQTE